MSSANSIWPDPRDFDLLAPLVSEGIRILPVVHERIEITALARSVLERVDPVAVAVELPTSLQAVSLRAVRRLPRISLLISEEPGEDALVWVVAPGDPLVESMRWALERDRPVVFVDPDLPYRERHRDPVPDPYAIWSLGGRRFLEQIRRHVRAATVSDLDRRREKGMAFHLQQLRQNVAGGDVLAVVGAAHLEGVAQHLERSQALPFARVSRTHCELRHLDPKSLTALLPDAPLAHAMWEKTREGVLPAESDLSSALSRKVSVVRFGLRVIHGEKGEPEEQRKHRLVDFACHRATRRLAECPFFPDRQALMQVVWQVGAGSYSEQTGEMVEPWQRRLFSDYARRCARVQGMLVPGLYDWTVASRGVGDDNLAWEVFDAARAYPWQEESAEIATAMVDGDELDLGTRKVRFRRRFLRVKSRPVPVPVRQHPRPDDPQEWLEAFDSSGLCSYPPEDLVIEDYGRFLQHRAVSILAAERKRSEPFSTSMLDGIDIRETLRNLHEDRVYVEEKGRVPGEAGSVVVIFDRDRGNAGFPFAMTWLGEHDQESDMAFYATSPAEQVVGPGIMRATYGGFMLTLPRGRLFDVWSDRDYAFAHDKAEVLTMAAIDYSLEKIVVHVAAEPPTDRIRHYAAVQGKQVTHIPLAALSPVTLKKIRVMHILAGKDKRDIARDYIW
jgi:hypothetical protein